MLESKRSFESGLPFHTDNFSMSPIIANFFLAMMSMSFLTKHRKDLKK
jgi:hypothetical protein